MHQTSIRSGSVRKSETQHRQTSLRTNNSSLVTSSGQSAAGHSAGQTDSVRHSGSSIVKFTTTSTSVVAPTTLDDASLLRAVQARTVLRGCGSTFNSKVPLDSNYKKSFQTTHIDDFLSHDWASGRWKKTMALCLVYNTRAALLATFLSTAAVSAMQFGSEPVLPHPKPPVPRDVTLSDQGAVSREYAYWCQVICPLVFVVFFLFWQEIRGLLQLSSRRCFLDKFCIDQTHPERKAAGILGLAGFLRSSNRMIVLWTPRYFTRLWCTYEVASWLHLHKPLSSVLFMPLAHAQIVLVYALACWVGQAFFILGVLYFPDMYLAVVVLTSWAGVSAGVHWARHSTNHLHTLANQLLNFSVTSSECYCCSVSHERSNGEEVPCDRQVVYTTIAEWFKDASGQVADVDMAIERFDIAVRTKFAPKVLAKAGPNQLSYRYVVLAGWPYLFKAGDVAAGTDEILPVLKFNNCLMYITMVFAAVPIWYRLAMQVTCCSDKLVGVPRMRVVDYCFSLLLGVVLVLLTLLIWSPLQLLASKEKVLPIALACAGYWVLAMCVYFRDLRSLCKGLCASPAHAGKDAPNPVDSVDTITSVSEPSAQKREELTGTPVDSTDDKGCQDCESVFTTISI